MGCTPSGEEGQLRFLHAASRGLGIQAAKEQEWNLGAYPILAWSWRPLEFPKGSDERKSKTNDSALVRLRGRSRTRRYR